MAKKPPARPKRAALAQPSAPAAQSTLHTDRHTTHTNSHTSNHTHTESSTALHAGHARIFVVGDQSFSAIPLPGEGKVLIGRDATCAIRIDDPSVSPVHAALHLDHGARVEARVEALQGETRVSGRTLTIGEEAEVAAGALIHVGAVLLMLEGRPTPPPRRLLPHDYFELRLEEECLRAERHALQFTVLRLRCSQSTPPEEIEETLADSVRLLDVVAAYGPGEYEVLLVDTPLEAAGVVAERVRRRLERKQAEPHLGLAGFPAQGRSADELTEAALAAIVGTATKEVPIALGPMHGLIEMLDRVAPSDLSVLVFGETGVGKERLAEQVHKRSHRADKPLVVLNCAALAESLLESELFGHEKGAFTGAHASKQGLLETAEGGTVFLDEIGELPMTVQVKLLRVLEDRKVLRVGSLKPRRIDVRFVAATNRDLEAEVARGAFRQDLFFRLNGISLHVPPLRERIEEIAPLARGFIAEASARMKRAKPPELGREVLALLEGYAWPGNVRELRNLIERAVLLCGDGPLRASHLPEAKLGAPFAARRTSWSPRAPLDGIPRLPPLRTFESEPPPRSSLAAHASTSHAPQTRPLLHAASGVSPRPNLPRGAGEDSHPFALAPPADAQVPAVMSLRDEVDALERARVAEALQRCAGNQSEAARMLGIPRRTLVKRLAAWGFPRPRKRQS